MIALSLLFIYTVCEYSAYVPQMAKLIRRKSADDFSLTTWLTWVVSGVCYLAYILMESPDLGVIFVASTNLFFIMSVCVLTVYYQKIKKCPKHVKAKTKKRF